MPPDWTLEQARDEIVDSLESIAVHAYRCGWLSGHTEITVDKRWHKTAIIVGPKEAGAGMKVSSEKRQE